MNSLALWLFQHRVPGAGRFHRSVLGGRPLRKRLGCGAVFDLNPHEYVDRIVIEHGFYESEVLDTVLAVLRDGDVFWDVGAYIGLHAVTVAHLRPSVECIAFEANPDILPSLRGNIERNRGSVAVVPVALDAADGCAPFFVHRGNAGRSGLVNWGSPGDAASVNTPVSRGDSLVQQRTVPSPNVIKLDVEGCEDRVISGLTETLASRSVRAIIFEDNVSLATPAKLALERAGFALHPLVRKEPTHHALENFLATRPPQAAG